jgi:riboflavin kinase/FMN adenylyltransferase
MLVEDELADFTPGKDMLLTVGVFDGVHLGHKYLISRLRENAAKQELLSGVVTFKQHPLEVLAPDTELPYLTGLNEKVRLLKNEGVDAVVTLSFTPELSALSASQFTGLLKKHLRMKGLVIGPDFSLGRNREGNAEALNSIGKYLDFTVEVVSPVRANGEVVSSTVIRNAITAGDMKKVVNLMGHPFSLHGYVTSGDKRGSELGFPTANLEIDPKQTLPPEGVYVTRTYIGNKPYKSVTNIGKRPTFGDNPRSIETYVMDYKSNLYGRELRIDIVERLRGEKKFDSVDGLKEQIALDIEKAIAVLDSGSSD